MAKVFGQSIIDRNAAAGGNVGMPTEFTSYDQVPWYQKRWFFVLVTLVLTPVGIVMALASRVYMLRDGKVLEFSKQRRFQIALTWTVLLAFNLVRYLL